MNLDININLINSNIKKKKKKIEFDYASYSKEESAEEKTISNIKANTVNNILSNYKFEKEYKQFIDLIRDDNFEPGIYSNTEKKGIELIKEKKLEVINEVVHRLINERNNEKNKTAAILLLRCLNFKQAKKINVQWEAMKLLNDESIYIIDLVVQLFEKWNSPECYPYLMDICSTGEKWLDDYIDEVKGLLR